jgi:hypothetical protein
LLDEDGEASDWIEIFNSGTNTVNMSGWFLTDSAGNLTKWQFPSRSVVPGGFLIVFASGKNRADPSGPLQANFSLNADGEYLALAHPDGFTIANEFAPQFPEQFENISYGVGQNLQVTRLVSNTSPATVFIPTNGFLGADWTAAGFNDSSWLTGTNGVGYETYVSGFAIRNFKANTTVSSVDAAEAVIITPSQQAGVFSENRSVVNYMNTGGGAHFASDATFPGLTINVDADDFVLEATGILTIPVAGTWTFGVNSDDGFRATIGTNTFLFPSPRGPADTFATFNLNAGEYPVRLVFYERSGGAEVEFFVAQGTHTSFNSNFRLVGDSANGGLAVKSLPASGCGGASLRSLINTDVQSQMLGRASSAYIRIPFALANPAAFSSLTLRMKYDDGFVAYLNGVEIARRNAPPSVQWNSVAASSRASMNALVFEDINVSGSLNSLVAGNNVLAIHGLSDSPNRADFLIAAELVENKVLGLTNHYFATPSPGAINGSGFYAFVENLKFTPGRGWFDTTNFSCNHHQCHARHFDSLHRKRYRAECDERRALHRRNSDQRHDIDSCHRLSRRIRANRCGNALLHFSRSGSGAVHERELGRRLVQQLHAGREHHAKPTLSRHVQERSHHDPDAQHRDGAAGFVRPERRLVKSAGARRGVGTPMLARIHEAQRRKRFQRQLRYSHSRRREPDPRSEARPARSVQRHLRREQAGVSALSRFAGAGVRHAHVARDVQRSLALGRHRRDDAA